MALALAGPVYAQSLSSLLDLARSTEPTYLGARSNVEAAKARTDQAFGALLPQLSMSGNTNSNRRDYRTRSTSIPPAGDAYNSNMTQLSLTQPLWHYANIVGWQQAEAVVVQAEHQLAGAEQELLSKLVTAWFDVLAAGDTIVFSAQQVSALQRVWEVARRGAELGQSGQPQVDEARSKLDQALADAVTAETDAQLKRAALEQLVGPLRELDLPYMRGVAELANLSTEKLEAWLDAAQAGNPNVLAALQAYEAAGAEVSKQRAGHYPTLDIVASYGKNSQAVGGFPGQAGYDIMQGVVGLQLNIPIFSGGTQSAKVSEALAQKEKARQDIEAARRATILAAKQAWFGWHAAYARAMAGVQAIKAARSAMALARKGRENGLKTEADVLQAEQQWRAAQRDFRKGRYDQVVSFVKLKAAAGVLTGGDVAALDALFVKLPDDTDPDNARPSFKVSRR
ncbi:TolC family outer membrane protein [Propionivibrio sp.]|uniref:TolC family outer membrane protein n=1 Tax=Propionivibrio sp. TaxID=2212460 RepID=UPI002635980B|nr:TolC family outer membrane protein [Propionivibrio sp.]